MAIQDFQSTVTVRQPPEEVFEAITHPQRWWTGDLEGTATALGDEFTYRYGELHYSRQRVTELEPDHRVVWQVVDSHLPGNDDPEEWTGTRIRFEISRREVATELRFSHQGLVPQFQCFQACSSAWGFYINDSLKRLITTGEGPTTPPWA